MPTKEYPSICLFNWLFRTTFFCIHVLYSRYHASAMQSITLCLAMLFKECSANQRWYMVQVLYSDDHFVSHKTHWTPCTVTASDISWTDRMIKRLSIKKFESRYMALISVCVHWRWFILALCSDEGQRYASIDREMNHA